MKAQDVKAEKQTLEVELKTLNEKFERESNRRQSTQKEHKELELQLSDLKSQLKVRDMKINQLEDENKTMKSELDNVKTTLNQSMDDWKVEKSTILDDHMNKFQAKESEMEKLRQLKSELNNLKFDLDKEKSQSNELRDKLDAKEIKVETLDEKCKALQRKLDIENSNKVELKSELGMVLNNMIITKKFKNKSNLKYFVKIFQPIQF